MSQQGYGPQAGNEPNTYLLCGEVLSQHTIRIEDAHNNKARDDGVGLVDARPERRLRRAPRVVFQDEDIHIGDDSDMSISEDDYEDEATSSDDDFIGSSDSSGGDDDLSYRSSISSGYSPDKDSVDEGREASMSAEGRVPAQETFGRVLTDKDLNATGVSSSSPATRSQPNGEGAGRRYRDSMNLRAILPPIAHSPPRRDDARMMGRAVHAFVNGRPLPRDRSGAKAIVRLADHGDKSFHR